MRRNSQGWCLDSPVGVYKSVTPLPALESLQGAMLLRGEMRSSASHFLPKSSLAYNSESQIISSFSMPITCCFL